MTTTVLIVDDDHLMRAGLTAVLESDSDIQVVGQASTGREAIAGCGASRTSC